MQSVAIAGVGLIGASFGLALRKAGFTGRIAGVSSPRSIEAGLARGAIDGGISLEEASRFELLFLAQPISGIIETLSRLSTGSIVTDAGSTKRSICSAAKHLTNFVGGHPMAGKELRGAESADADLFQDRPWLLTSEPPAKLRHWIEAIGARILVVSPEEHDRLVARASHLPQMIANVMARVTEPSKSAGGPGLDAMTRLSRSSYTMWRDIIATNRDEIGAALDEFLTEAWRLRSALTDEDEAAIRAYFRTP